MLQVTHKDNNPHALVILRANTDVQLKLLLFSISYWRNLEIKA